MISELSNTENDLWLSPVSVWEALVLMQKGRIPRLTTLCWVERATDTTARSPDYILRLFASGLGLLCRMRIPPTGSSLRPRSL